MWCHLSHAAGSATDSVIVMMVYRRVIDEKVGVRKAALLALESIIRLDIRNISRDVSILLLADSVYGSNVRGEGSIFHSRLAVLAQHTLPTAYCNNIIQAGFSVGGTAD